MDKLKSMINSKGGRPAGRAQRAQKVRLIACLLVLLCGPLATQSRAETVSSAESQTGASSPAGANSLAAAWRAQMQQLSPAARPLPQRLPAGQLQQLGGQVGQLQQQPETLGAKGNSSGGPNGSPNGQSASGSSGSSGPNGSATNGGQMEAQQQAESFPNPNINNAGHEITKILRKFFQHGYDKRVRPNYSGPPALVNVSFHIIGISSVSEVQMDFTTDFYFRQKWFDPRLEFKPVGQIDELCVGAEFAEKIWLPDTFFANEKTANFHKATTENTFIRVGHNGRVYRSIRLTVTCSCPMDLQYFPMDRQRCKIEIESYGYNTRDIDYRWEKGNESVSLDGKIELPQFKVLGFKMGQELQSLSSGDYIRLYCEVHFVRSMGYYLIQIYIPASLIVIISWVSFWLHRNATPARVALGVTTVLTMTTLMSSTNAALPKISYIKSIDVFLGTCFVMVFASLLEYASVGYIGKRIAMKRKYQMDLKQMQQHHQKVCVAAAASAAAAAAAARQANPVGVAPNLYHGAGVGAGTKAAAKQLLVLQEGGAQNGSKTTTQRPILMRRLTQAANDFLAPHNQPPLQLANRNQQQSLHGPHRQSLAATLVGVDAGQQAATTLPQPTGHNQPGVNHKQGPPTQHHHQQLTNHHHNQQASQEPSDPSAVVISKAAAEQSGEADVRICGLTPSDIDKYSRVVFPICFVCFNLMYWIIYGHISQQIDDHGPPLIPFVRS